MEKRVFIFHKRLGDCMPVAQTWPVVENLGILKMIFFSTAMLCPLEHLAYFLFSLDFAFPCSLSVSKHTDS